MHKHGIFSISYNFWGNKSKGKKQKMSFLTGKKLVLDYSFLGIHSYLPCTTPVGFVWRKERNLNKFDKIKLEKLEFIIVLFLQSMQLFEAFLSDFVITLLTLSDLGLCGRRLCDQETLWDKSRRREQAFFVADCCFFGCFCLQEGLIGPKTWFLEFNFRLNLNLNYKINFL